MRSASLDYADHHRRLLHLQNVATNVLRVVMGRLWVSRQQNTIRSIVKSIGELVGLAEVQLCQVVLAPNQGLS